MTDETTPTPQPQSPQPRWQPISLRDRRVAGVLVEKAKTTPSAYPMTLNAVTTGCNQKSNRDPVIELQPDDVEESLDRLRKLGAVGLVEGYGRVVKYRHYLYEWLGVDKVELAVMAELMLRGAQTVGELRGRAARMEPIRDMAELEPVLDALEAKGLVIPLTQKGRGQVVTHALYSPNELERVKSQFASARMTASAAASAASAAVTSAGAVDDDTVAELRGAIDDLRAELTQTRSDLDDLAQQQTQTADELRRLRAELGA